MILGILATPMISDIIVIGWISYMISYIHGSECWRDRQGFGSEFWLRPSYAETGCI